MRLCVLARDKVLGTILAVRDVKAGGNEVKEPARDRNVKSGGRRGRLKIKGEGKQSDSIFENPSTGQAPFSRHARSAYLLGRQNNREPMLHSRGLVWWWLRQNG